jgi:hypothetical protein
MNEWIMAARPIGHWILPFPSSNADTGAVAAPTNAP